MANYVKKVLSDSDIHALKDAIRKVEELTSGEVRVVLREKRTWRERAMSLESIAHREFTNLKMHQTKDRTGVLILVFIKNRQLYVYADEGIYTKIGKTELAVIANEIAERFSKNEYREGLLQGITRVGDLLARFFPKKPNDVNELPNDVVVR